MFLEKKGVCSVRLQPVSSAFVAHVKAQNRFRKGWCTAHGWRYEAGRERFPWAARGPARARQFL